MNPNDASLRQLRFQSIIDENRDRMGRIARVYAGSDAEDLVQEILMQIGLKVRNASNQLKTRIFHRDMRESLASALVFVLFFPGLLIAKNWVMWSGFAIEVIAEATIPFVLWRARKKTPGTTSTANFRDFIDLEPVDERRQRNLATQFGAIPRRRRRRNRGG